MPPRVVWEGEVKGFRCRVVDRQVDNIHFPSPAVEVLQKNAMGDDVWISIDRSSEAEFMIGTTGEKGSAVRRVLGVAVLELFDQTIPEPGGVHRNEDEGVHRNDPCP